MPETWDCVVVGAGFAGLACGRAAAAAGCSVLVLEAKPEVGTRPHSTGLLWPDVAASWSVPPHLTRPVHGVRLYSPSLKAIDIKSDGPALYATDTPELMRWLAREAEGAGAVIRTGAPWSDDNPSCRFLVGADGPRSRVAERIGLGRNREFLVGVEAEYEGVRGLDEDRVHGFLDSTLAPGYLAWVIPGCGITQVGLAARAPHVPRLDAFVERISCLFDFRGARMVARRGGLFPIGGPVTPWHQPGVILVGDAAGFTSPLTGGGIARALKCGDLVGSAIAEHLRAGGPVPAESLKPEIPRLPWRRGLRWLMDLAPPNRVLDALMGLPWFVAFARALVLHPRENDSAALPHGTVDACTRPISPAPEDVGPSEFLPCVRIPQCQGGETVIEEASAWNEAARQP